ncbi:DUF1652 domain-containing protein [Pseudomonas sp. Irchel s3h17]|uniref:DUF1652 domain-containing protein n=1 Tax=Pseudomonas sp. Irchel s3h17 TaxID=2009182 RepID=UPI000BA31AED|nr:DUF1652 domain-containing protein [Pseudomonas sp. Irchel s3h17]
MLSTLELRHLVEQSFLPTRCECMVDPTAALTVRFFQGTSNQEMLVVTGISIAPLNNGFAIASLIADLRKELERAGSAPLYLAHYSANT